MRTRTPREGGACPVQVVDANLEIDLADELSGPRRAGAGLLDEAVALVAGGVAATGCERVVLKHARLVPGLDFSELARRLSPALAADVSIFTDEADDDAADASRNLALLVRGCASMAWGAAPAGDFCLRVFYAKGGAQSALPHRDTMREMERCVRRAGLPYDVSCGARPHMRVVPGPALPPGCTGRAEPFDVRLCAYVPAAEARGALNRVMPSGLEAVSCVYVGLHSPGAAQAFFLSDWEARVAGVCAGALQAAFDELVAQGFLELKKARQTKDGTVEKVKRVDFDGRLAAAPVVVDAPGAGGAEADGLVLSGAAAASGAEGASLPSAAAPLPDTAQPGALCTWTTRDAGNGALRADLFMNEVLSRVPGARLSSLVRTGLRAEE